MVAVDLLATSVPPLSEALTEMVWVDKPLDDAEIVAVSFVLSLSAEARMVTFCGVDQFEVVKVKDDPEATEMFESPAVRATATVTFALGAALRLTITA